jgi:hypothetical protein
VDLLVLLANVGPEILLRLSEDARKYAPAETGEELWERCVGWRQKRNGLIPDDRGQPHAKMSTYGTLSGHF